MPLRIERGNYTVNDIGKKSLSQFLPWKNWRHSVHNGRADHRSTVVHSEVAGLDIGTTTESCAVEVVPGSGNTRPTLHLRPLSLAVEPLHYHQLNSDATRKHFNMTSQESIGSCSLDVDTSASDRSDTEIGSVSDKTLHSLNLSCNSAELLLSSENLSNGNGETIPTTNSRLNKENLSNLHNDSSETEHLTAKKPSYLGLACSISGYSGITRYDSKLREGFRSRDTSPGTRLITRDTSPASFRSSENLNLPPQHHPAKTLSISPLAMERQNGMTNGIKEEYKIHSFVETRSSISTCHQGYSEVDRGVPLHTTYADINPVRGSPDVSPIKKSPGMVRVVSFSQQSKSFMSTVTESSNTRNISNTSVTEINTSNGSSIGIDNESFNSSSSSEKSFIQQRVERLYGPGALAQGFFYKRSSTKLNTNDCFLNKSVNINNNNNASSNSVNDESLKSLPVLRHLRPEFRAQLPVVSPRKPTDGSEQIKSLQRTTPTTKKPEEKDEISSNLPNQNSYVARSESVTNSNPNLSNLKNIPDQQPAALEVVLPVPELSASSNNISKNQQVVEKITQEKDGHYFMMLLKAETERLLVLAASAEAELAGGDPSTLPEEAAGKLRSAAGKARLLATQKMQQFEGLCQKNINQVPGEEFPTTNEDLAGFWDMVMLQVIQINESFEQIRRLKDSQWQETIPDDKMVTSTQNGSTTKRRVVVANKVKPTVNNESSRKAREAREQARRQMIEDRRRAMRLNGQNKSQSDADTVTIFAPET